MAIDSQPEAPRLPQNPLEEFTVTKAARLAFGLVLMATLAFAAPATAQDPVQQVDQALHDNVAAAYENVSSFIGDMDGNVSDVARGTFDTAKSDLEAIEARIGGAVDNVGDAAVGEYRQIQHALRGVARDAGGFLHRVGHKLEGVEHDAWSGLQDGVHDVANTIDHAIDSLRP